MTYEEYEALKKETVSPVNIDEQKVEVPGLPEPPQQALIIEDKREFLLFHPDNGIDRKVNGKYYIDNIEIPIIDGVINVGTLELKESLIRAGFVFMYEKKIEAQI